MFVDRRLRQGRTLRPDLGKKIEIGAKGDARNIEGRSQLLCGSETEDRSIDHQRFAARHVSAQPVDVVRARAGWNALQFYAAIGQLLLGLLPVARIGKQRRGASRDDECAHRTGKTRKPFTTLPVPRQILGKMRVGGGDKDRERAVTSQGGPHTLDAFGNRGNRDVHVLLRRARASP